MHDRYGLRKRKVIKNLRDEGVSGRDRRPQGNEHMRMVYTWILSTASLCCERYVMLGVGIRAGHVGICPDPERTVQCPAERFRETRDRRGD